MVAAAVVASAGVAWMLSTPTQFTATSIVSLRPDPGAEFSAEILIITAHEYVAYISSPQVMEANAARSGPGVEDLSGSTNVSVEAGTTNVRIDVRLSSSSAAATAANRLASAAEAEGRNDRLVAVKSVSRATAESADPGPSQRLLFIVTGALAVLIGLLVWYLMDRPWDRQAERLDTVDDAPRPRSRNK